MSLAPSTYYHRPKPRSAAGEAAEARLVARIRKICAESPRHGYRRVTAQLKAEGERVNHKRMARIMREQDLRVRPRRRFVVTTDSGHDGPIFPDLAKGVAPAGPALGRGPDLHPRPHWLRLPRRDPGRLVAPGGGLGDQPEDRRRADPGRAGGGDRGPGAAAGLYPPLGLVEGGVFDPSTPPSRTARSSGRTGS